MPKVATDEAAEASPAGMPQLLAKIRTLNRLRRIEGQVRGLQRMVKEDHPCADILSQVSSVHEALRAAGRELLRDHMKQTIRQAIRQDEAATETMCDEVVALIFRHGGRGISWL
jgi:DNA-binding FrmR family transcriptional regulator